MDYGIKNGRAYKRRAMFVQLQQLKKTYKECTPENKKQLVGTDPGWQNIKWYSMTVNMNRYYNINHVQIDGRHD